MSLKNSANRFPDNATNGQNFNILNKVFSTNNHLHHFHLARKKKVLKIICSKIRNPLNIKISTILVKNSFKSSKYFNLCAPTLILKAFLIQSIIVLILKTHSSKSPVSIPNPSSRTRSQCYHALSVLATHSKITT